MREVGDFAETTDYRLGRATTVDRQRMRADGFKHDVQEERDVKES